VESQANVRSTIQRHFKTWKPLGRICSQSMIASLGAHTYRRPLQGCSTISTSHPSVALFPRLKAAFLVRTVGPDELQSGEAALERLQEMLAALLILDVGLMHQHVQDQAQSVDEQMPLAPFHPLAAIIAAPPPISLVFTDWLSMMAALGVGSRP
jgi:hypothetical protein